MQTGSKIENLSARKYGMETHENSLAAATFTIQLFVNGNRAGVQRGPPGQKIRSPRHPAAPFLALRLQKISYCVVSSIDAFPGGGNSPRHADFVTSPRTTPYYLPTAQ